MPVKSVLLLTDTGVINTSEFGGKAANLARLIQAGIPVPMGLAVGIAAFDTNHKLQETAKQQIIQLVDDTNLYAVRSSSLAEDAIDASWAGQFETFLNVEPRDIIAKIEECHGSTKNRAKAYAKNKTTDENFKIGVVVQEMVKPEYAGVLFTKDPLTGHDQFITEYVAGLGEELVSGRADPKRISIDEDQNLEVEFDYKQLVRLARVTEELFGTPQDIEWVWAANKIWFVQARPITATQISRAGYFLGEPSELFYWGPSRTKPMYMSDFMAAVERFFIEMTSNADLPTPPKTVVLFDEGKMVWLSNAQEFANFTEKVFSAYEGLNQLPQDIANWERTSNELEKLSGYDLEEKIVQAWYYTEFAEFSLYGAETSLVKRLERFEPKIRHNIWSAFTTPDTPTFLARIDSELAMSQNPTTLSEKYPWIQDGYDGLSGNALQYFEDRLKIVDAQIANATENKQQRVELAEKLRLSNTEIKALTLARELAEFMDNRKAWMMKTRRLLTSPVGTIEHGWFFNNGEISHIDQETTHELWQRYVDFKASSNAVVGVVASNGDKHFVNGEVVVVTNPTDSVEDGKILVVPSTSPSYVPLMRNAKGLVTDHGGMMSHAAIVAREFNLPCIVGTKQATKVLKNGDNIVLDLVNGEVNRNPTLRLSN
jgi:phosphohistidine swiveling domain-containing protein